MVGFGTALAGYGQAQPQIQALLDKQKQDEANKQAFAVLAQMAAQQQGGAPAALPGGTPAAPAGGMSSPQGGPVPINRPAMPPSGAPPAPASGQSPAAMPALPGGAPSGAAAPSPAAQTPNPRSDMFAMINKIAALNVPDNEKMAILEKVGATTAPLEKYTQQLEMAQTKLQGQMDMLAERQRTLVQLQQMRDTTSAANTDKRVGAQERGQDIASSDRGKRLDLDTKKADEKARHDQALEDINNDKSKNQALRDKLRQEEIDRHNKAVETINQQKADTGTTNANTKKTEMFLKDKRSEENLDFKKMALKEKNELITRGQDKQYQARLAAIAAKGTPPQQTEFKAAQTEFMQASANYRNAKLNPGSSMEDINAMATAAAQAQQKMEQAAAQAQQQSAPPAAQPAPANLPPGIKPEDITPENLEHTAKLHNMTVEEVKKKLGIE